MFFFFRGKLGGGDEENASEPLHPWDLEAFPVRQIACGPNCTMAVTHSGLERDLVYKEKRPTIQVSSLYRMCSLCRVLKET